MLTFLYPGCTCVPDGPGSECWRMDSAATSRSCVDGTGLENSGNACWMASSQSCIGSAAALKAAIHSLFGFLRGCIGSGSVELGGFGRRPYSITDALTGAASPSLAFLLGGGTHSSQLALKKRKKLV